MVRKSKLIKNKKHKGRVDNLDNEFWSKLKSTRKLMGNLELEVSKEKPDMVEVDILVEQIEASIEDIDRITQILSGRRKYYSDVVRDFNEIMSRVEKLKEDSDEE